MTLSDLLKALRTVPAGRKITVQHGLHSRLYRALGLCGQCGKIYSAQFYCSSCGGQRNSRERLKRKTCNARAGRMVKLAVKVRHSSSPAIAGYIVKST